MSNLHPVFQAALATFSQPDVIRSAQRSAYIQALKNHDWSFEFSDDQATYAAGRESLAQLKLAQRELDADFAIWNQHAPAVCRNGGVYQ